MEINAKKALVILNASAGIGNANAAGNAVAESLASDGYEVKTVRIMTDEKVLAGAGFPDDSGLVVCCGGDGTFNQVLNRYSGSKTLPAFAYIPCGHTNSFAKSLGISEDTVTAVDTAVRGRSCKCDYGKVNDRSFNYVASFGSAATMTFVTSQQMKKVFEYSKHILRAIGELHMNIGESFHMAIETDAGTFEDDYIFGAISNLSAVDGVYFSDESLKNNDGIMDLLLIRRPGTRYQAKEVLNALREGSTDHPLIQIKHITRGSFTSTSDIAWSFDGEFGGIQKQAKLEVLKEGLTVKVP